MSKKLINGLKYKKLTEEQLYDLSQWELVDIILAYRNELLRKEQECERLKEVNRHIEHNRTQKADKLMRTEKLITACSTGYTDEFIQELLVILHEPEPIKE